MPETDIRLLTAYETAQLLRISRSTLARLYGDGRIPAPRRIGNQLRWDADELYRFLRDQDREGSR